MESANAFQENVLAYPAVTLLTNTLRKAEIEYASIKDVRELESLNVHLLPHPIDENWSLAFANDKDCSILQFIEEQGFSIGIGVATGADSIYVSTEFKDVVEEDLLIPTVNAKNLKGNEMKWDGRYIINPYTPGTLINLDKYPKAKKYFENHREKLATRHKAKKIHHDGTLQLIQSTESYKIWQKSYYLIFLAILTFLLTKESIILSIIFIISQEVLIKICGY